MSRTGAFRFSAVELLAAIAFQLSTFNQQPLPNSDFGLRTSELPWQPPAVGHDGADWIKLKSGEWLKGRLYYIQERKVEFESDELKDLSFVWDYLQNPQTESSGNTPQRNDFRLNVGAGVKF